MNRLQRLTWMTVGLLTSLTLGCNLGYDPAEIGLAAATCDPVAACTEATQTITVVTPRPGQMISSDEGTFLLQFEVDVSGYCVVDAVDEPNAPCEGHLCLYINEMNVGVPVTSTRGLIDVTPLPPGLHFLRVAMCYNDGMEAMELLPVEVEFERGPEI